MNEFEVASLIHSLRLLQQACPMDTYEQQVAHRIATVTLSMVPNAIAKIALDMEAA